MQPEKYKIEEGKKPVKLKDITEFNGKKYTIIERDFINESDVVRHDPKKLAEVIKELSE